MEELLLNATGFVVPIIDGIALVVVVLGTVEAFVNSLRLAFADPTGHEIRVVWLHYARWLVAGLTFQLAADIIETSTTPDWQDIARLAAIALIRTFLNYFLERDLADVREIQSRPAGDVRPS